MKNLRLLPGLFPFLMLLLGSPGYLLAQPDQGVGDIYGLDQTLYNGKSYIYKGPAGAVGNQYFSSHSFSEGTLFIRGKSYPGLLLNYDILNQQVLLKYSDAAGNINIIEVSEGWLEGFRIDSLDFERLTFDGKTSIFQVTGHGNCRFLHQWRKTLKLEGSVGNAQFEYSKPLRNSYLLCNGILQSFFTNKSLIRLMPQDKQSGVRAYLRQHHINLKKATDKDFLLLADFISDLITTR